MPTTDIRYAIDETIRANWEKPDGLVTRIKSRSQWWAEVIAHSEGIDCINGAERLYLYWKNMQPPVCGCGSGRRPKFLSMVLGYNRFCRSNCSAAKAAQVEGRRKTMPEGMGLADPKRLKKAQETVRRKYNVANVGQLSAHREMMRTANPMSRQEVVESYREGAREQGVEWHSQRPDVQEKMKATSRVNWGVNNPMQSPLVAALMVQAKLANFYEKLGIRNDDMVVPMFKVEDYKGVVDRSISYPWKCQTCGSEFHHHLDDGNIPRCFVCFPVFPEGQSIEENEIYEVTKSIAGYEPIRNSRQLLKPYEVDLYFPKHNIAIEYNGLYFHSELGVNKVGKDYHLNKLQRASEKDVRLIQIFTDEWLFKRSICQQRLRHIFGWNRDRLYGRDTSVVELERSEASNFVERHHIQGNVTAEIALGLRFENRTVAVMTFGPLRAATGKRARDGRYELLRFCSNGTSVVGGASKLFRAFVKQRMPKQVITYADLRWNTGRVYEKMGFRLVGQTEPNYWYFHRNKVPRRIHRFAFQKHRLVEQFGADPRKTEWQIMQEQGFDRVWDCGSLRYEWTPDRSQS